MSTWPAPTHDSPQARALRIAHPGFSHCLRCGYPWCSVNGHSTPYAPNRSCFPLCEDCWALLAHPEARIPYYATLLDIWAPTMPAEELADVRRGLTQSVAAGL